MKERPTDACISNGTRPLIITVIFMDAVKTSISAINVSTVTVVAGLTSYCNSK